jgi:hypothetical protein
MAAGRCRRRELGRPAGTTIMISPPARLTEGRIVGRSAGAIVIIAKRILLGSGTVQVQRILLALRQLAQDRLHLGAPRLQRLSMMARHGGARASTPAAVPFSKSGHGHQIISWASLLCAAGDGWAKDTRARCLFQARRGRDATNSEWPPSNGRAARGWRIRRMRDPKSGCW